MGFSGKVKMRLWGTAQAMCCLCREPCIADAEPGDDRSNVGECAHIVGERPDAARHDPAYSPQEIDAEGNGLLLCARCHKMVDDQPGKHTVDYLRTLKMNHTRWLQDLVIESMGTRRIERTLILHSSGVDIPEDLAVEALSPDYPAIPTLELRVDQGQGWEAASLHQAGLVAEMRRSGAPDSYAVFSLAEIPLCIHLGALLGNRQPASLFQHDRHRGRWVWPENPGVAEADMVPIVEELPDERTERRGPVMLRISLSASVGLTDCTQVLGDPVAQAHIRVGDPSRDWLRSPQQLEEFGRCYTHTIEQINARVPNCTAIHVFAAVPCGAAFQIGRLRNPNMDPPLVLYQHSRMSTPRYAVTLKIE